MVWKVWAHIEAQVNISKVHFASGSWGGSLIWTACKLLPKRPAHSVQTINIALCHLQSSGFMVKEWEGHPALHTKLYHWPCLSLKVCQEPSLSCWQSKSWAQGPSIMTMCERARKRRGPREEWWEGRRCSVYHFPSAQCLLCATTCAKCWACGFSKLAEVTASCTYDVLRKQPGNWTSPC